MATYIKKISDSISRYIQNNSSLKSKDEFERMSYSLQALISESIKVLTYIVLFSLMNKLDLFLFSFLVLSSVRIFVGGYHSKNFFNCLIFSFIFFFITCFSSSFLKVTNSYFYFTCIIISIIVVIFKAPMASKYRPIKNKNRYNKLKTLSVVTILLWSILLFFLINNIELRTVGVLTIFLESIQLLFKKEMN